MNQLQQKFVTELFLNNKINANTLNEKNNLAHYEKLVNVISAVTIKGVQSKG